MQTQLQMGNLPTNVELGAGIGFLGPRIAPPFNEIMVGLIINSIRREIGQDKDWQVMSRQRMNIFTIALK